MLWIKAFHIIFMVTWFSGLFYLPRLFVYHADCNDAIGNARFKIMERKLYFGITTPTALLTLFFGGWLMTLNWPVYKHLAWLHLKLGLVLLLLIYHVYLGKLLFDFKHDRNQHRAIYYRILNEIPVIFLFGIILLVVLKPVKIL